MKTPKKKKQPNNDAEDIGDEDTRHVRFEALEELTHGDIVAQLKNGLSSIDPLEHEDDFRDEAA
jgi:hypothetical protein